MAWRGRIFKDLFWDWADGSMITALMRKPLSLFAKSWKLIPTIGKLKRPSDNAQSNSAADDRVRCYVSRVENGHTVPDLDTIEKWARALKIELYQILFEGGGKPEHLSVGAMEVQNIREKQRHGFFRQGWYKIDLLA